ncbi:tyrosinase [Pseudohyphozyma bogoriensis]|nr:tyrosinase [Pseudohyphozyma bogoriensis]
MTEDFLEDVAADIPVPEEDPVSEELPDYEDEVEKESLVVDLPLETPAPRRSIEELMKDWFMYIKKPAPLRSKSTNFCVRLHVSEYNLWTLEQDIELLTRTLMIRSPNQIHLPDLPRLFDNSLGYRLLLLKPDDGVKTFLYRITFEEKNPDTNKPVEHFANSSEEWDDALKILEERGLEVRDVARTYEELFRPEEKGKAAEGEIEVELENLHEVNSIWWKQLVALTLIKKTSYELADPRLVEDIQAKHDQMTDIEDKVDLPPLEWKRDYDHETGVYDSWRDVTGEIQKIRNRQNERKMKVKECVGRLEARIARITEIRKEEVLQELRDMGIVIVVC